MKQVFRIDVVGDAEVRLNGDITDGITFFFRSFDQKKMIETLNNITVMSISEKRNDRHVNAMKIAIIDAKNFIQHTNTIGFMQDFGGNQHVRIEGIYIPTEEDFED